MTDAWLQLAAGAFDASTDDARWLAMSAQAFDAAAGAGHGTLAWRMRMTGAHVEQTMKAASGKQRARDLAVVGLDADLVNRFAVAGDVGIVAQTLGRRYPAAIAGLRALVGAATDGIYLLCDDDAGSYCLFLTPRTAPARIRPSQLVPLRCAASLLSTTLRLRRLGDRQALLAQRAEVERIGRGNACGPIGLASLCAVPPNALTAREHQVAMLAARALGNKEIAYELCVGTSTVAVQLARALAKLSFRNRFELCCAVAAGRRTPGRPLTLSETEVLQEAQLGRSNRAIARERGTSERTVANQLASIFRKSGVRSRGQLPPLAAR